MKLAYIFPGRLPCKLFNTTSRAAESIGSALALIARHYSLLLSFLFNNVASSREQNPFARPFIYASVKPPISFYDRAND